MQSPLRVLVVTIVHDPEDARIRHRQLPALLDAGHHVVYAAPFRAFGRTPPEGVRGIDLPRAQGARRIPAVLAARRVLELNADSADVILIHDPDLLLAAAGLGRWRGGRRARAEVVWDVHEDTAAALTMRSWVPDRLRRPLAAGVRLTEQVVEHRYTLLLAEHGYRSRFRRGHAVVPNSVRVPAESPSPPGGDRVVYLGKLTRPRGGAELIELARLVPELTVEIIGPAESDIADELAAAHDAGIIDWRGFVPNDVALARLDGALAGVSLLHDEPNYAHSQPTKVIEYMSHGLPVITTPNAAPKELVEAAGAGAVVPFGDVAQAAATLRAWAADPALRARVGMSGYEYARAHLDWNSDARGFVAAIEDAGREAHRVRIARSDDGRSTGGR